MKLNYGDLISFEPIPIIINEQLIGNIKKPLLSEIAKLQFPIFEMYQVFLKITPESFYQSLANEQDKEVWNKLNKSEKESLTLYDVITQNDELFQTYLSILSFFFVEPIIAYDKLIIVLKEEVANEEELSKEKIQSIITKDTFPQVIEIIQQVCCIYDEEQKVEEENFKNDLAKKLFEKMQKSQKVQKEKMERNKNLTLANIVSKVCMMHNSLNYINIWQITLPQLYDAFNWLQRHEIYEIDKHRASVWGDEKNTFDLTLWYKNEYD